MNSVNADQLNLDRADELAKTLKKDLHPILQNFLENKVGEDERLEAAIAVIASLGQLAGYVVGIDLHLASLCQPILSRGYRDGVKARQGEEE